MDWVNPLLKNPRGGKERKETRVIIISKKGIAQCTQQKKAKARHYPEELANFMKNSKPWGPDHPRLRGRCGWGGFVEKKTVGLGGFYGKT